MVRFIVHIFSKNDRTQWRKQMPYFVPIGNLLCQFNMQWVCRMHCNFSYTRPNCGLQSPNLFSCWCVVTAPVFVSWWQQEIERSITDNWTVLQPSKVWDVSTQLLRITRWRKIVFDPNGSCNQGTWRRRRRISRHIAIYTVLLLLPYSEQICI